MASDDDTRLTQITQLLSTLASEPATGQTTGAPRDLLALLYTELKALARTRMAALPPGNTLQATALVHEAWLRLGDANEASWNGRHHFFGAAAEAMRQILVDAARHKHRQKRGGDRQRVELDDAALAFECPPDEVLAVEDVLTQIESESPRIADVLRLRYHGGLSVEETAAALDISPRTVKREWRLVRAMIHSHLLGDDASASINEGRRP